MKPVIMALLGLTSAQYNYPSNYGYNNGYNNATPYYGGNQYPSTYNAYPSTYTGGWNAPVQNYAPAPVISAPLPAPAWTAPPPPPPAPYVPPPVARVYTQCGLNQQLVDSPTGGFCQDMMPRAPVYVAPPPMPAYVPPPVTTYVAPLAPRPGPVFVTCGINQIQTYDGSCQTCAEGKPPNADGNACGDDAPQIVTPPPMPPAPVVSAPLPPPIYTAPPMPSPAWNAPPMPAPAWNAPPMPAPVWNAPPMPAPPMDPYGYYGYNNGYIAGYNGSYNQAMSDGTMTQDANGQRSTYVDAWNNTRYLNKEESEDDVTEEGEAAEEEEAVEEADIISP